MEFTNSYCSMKENDHSNQFTENKIASTQWYYSSNKTQNITIKTEQSTYMSWRKKFSHGVKLIVKKVNEEVLSTLHSFFFLSFVF